MVTSAMSPTAPSGTYVTPSTSGAWQRARP